jgi:hypothetical protein
MRLGVVALAVVAAASIAGLFALHDRPGWFTSLHNVSSPAAIPPTSSKTPLATTTTLAPGSDSSLTISAIVPSSGMSGQRVTIIGSNLVGSGGYLVATFDGSPVPTSCLNEEQCAAVVPPRTHGTTATVRLQTKAGTSNAVTFRYG